MLQERGNLPQYGTCWKAAVEQVHEGCRFLSEETQSDIALHLTNCFLQMSGHGTYNCELDKKANLRGICINNMSDRAFNVYTEFYTHTQNICWFLRGQVWNEMIAENTIKVARQMDLSAKNQENLLKMQQESIFIQGKIIDSMKDHEEILNLFVVSLGNLQKWMIGEVSWFETIIFYTTYIIGIILFTSTIQTSNARLFLFLLVILSIVIEQFITFLLASNEVEQNMLLFTENLNKVLWWYRYFILALSICILIKFAYCYKDVATKNNDLLKSIHRQNILICNKLENLTNDKKVSNGNCSYILEKSFENKSNSLNNASLSSNESNFYKYKYKNNLLNVDQNYICNENEDVEGSSNYRNYIRYNLRSQRGTPELNKYL